MSVIRGLRYICLVCSNEETIRCSKEDYKEVHVCPKCHGALVDIWQSGKYRKSISLGKEIKQSLLQITLDEENGVPKVFYKGEEIKLNREIFFHWESDKAIAGGLTYSIEHVEPGLVVNRIERRVKGHACD
ncbi:hypothetical protein NSS71_25420 [Niallia sp. FSL W8-0951]|uniref:hypothetical protein n=1 Tax=Niallia sp. FSL W8-0951 TaxID=2954639 RepID=UPI0030FBFF51